MEPKLLVSSNRSGIWNAYAIPVVGGEPQPLTSSTSDAVFAASYFPNDGRLLYTSDEGGNELAHVYVRAEDGTTKISRQAEKLNARFFGWADDDRSFFVASNERDQRYFDLYEYATDGYARTLFYRNTDGFDLGPVSRDKRYFALGKSRTTNDSDIWLIDRKAATKKNITAHKGDVSNPASDFSPDGTTLLFLSDAGREFKSLRGYNLATGQQKAILEPDWDIWGAAYSKSGKYLTVCVNEDAAYTTRLYQADTMKEVRLAGMPAGLVRGLQISRDDRLLAFYASDGSVPEDLYAGILAGRPTRLTSALNPRSSATTWSCRRACASSHTTASRFPACCTRRGRLRRRQGSGARQGPRRSRRAGAVWLLRPHAGARQPRVRRVRHQQPRQHRLRQDLLRHGRPQARRGRPGRRRG